MAVLGLLAWVVGWSPLLGVRSVTVEGVRGAEARSVAEVAAVAPGTPLLSVDTAAVAERVRARTPGAASVRVTRSWPDSLTVRVEPRRPALVLRNSHGQLEVVDANGNAYAVVERVPDGVPLVSAASAGGRSPEAVRAALALVRALPPVLAGRVRAVTVEGPQRLTFRVGRTAVVWGGPDQAARKVAVLQPLLRTTATWIDVSAPNTPVTR